MDGPMPDSTHLDVSGGWHDATDYLQHSMTSANATYHLLAAYRDFGKVFGDVYLGNGLTGANGTADVLDEAKWGLEWLLKMHPKPEWMFNQLADDRDHKGFRLPNKDTASYGRGKERPIYFLTGKVQGLGKYKNRTTGTSSSAGKFSSAFALGYQIFRPKDKMFSDILRDHSVSAYDYALKIPGNTQTACLVSPYFYEEDNWVDDMELAATQMHRISGEEKFLETAFSYAKQEPQTPWLGKDTASHYQWYPFVNVGHYELALASQGAMREKTISFYKKGIELVLRKAETNAFLRGVPFIWCSNNLQAAFAVQCYWYRQLSGDQQFAELEQATFDWLLGCNPWGTSMIVGLPEKGDYPDDPHSSLNFINGYQTLGALVDGPVYGSIYKKQLGVSIVRGDEYAAFQSPLVVYHDDYGDYVTNEPTMDGTANLVYLLAGTNRDSTLVTQREFTEDLLSNYKEMENWGVRKDQSIYFLPPFEWYNDSIASWTKQLGLQLVNYSPGTISHADYTTPEMKNYKSSEEILQSVFRSADDLNGFILLMHIGTDAARKDKLYSRLPELIKYLRAKKYEFVTVPTLLSKD